MANEKNLIPFTSDQNREEGKKGGVASGEKRRQNKTFRDLAKVLLSVKIGKEEYNNLSQDFLKELRKIDKDINVDNKVFMLLKQIQKAKEGDTKAFEVVRDTSGETPITKTQQEVTVSAPLQIIDDVSGVEGTD